MEFDELSQNVIGCESKFIATSDRAYSNRPSTSVWLVSFRTRAFRFRWSWRCRFVTKISCSIAAIGSICSYVAISSWKSKASKRFFQSIKHKFLRTCASPRCRSACLSISTSQSCKTASNVSFCDSFVSFVSFVVVRPVPSKGWMRAARRIHFSRRACGRFLRGALSHSLRASLKKCDRAQHLLSRHNEKRQSQLPEVDA